MFCAGTSNRAAARRKPVQSWAVSRSRIASAVRDGRSPVQASDTAYGPPASRRLRTDVTQVGRDVGEDRTVRRGAHRDRHVGLAVDVDRLATLAQRQPTTAVEPLVTADMLEEEVGHVGVQVGEPPGDVGVVTDHHTGHAREGEARDVERAARPDHVAVQADLHPDAGDADAEVRVVGQQRLAGGRVRAVDDPAVAADAAAVAHQLRDVREPAAQPAQGVALPHVVRRSRAARASRAAVTSCSKVPWTTAPWSTIGGCSR